MRDTGDMKTKYFHCLFFSEAVSIQIVARHAEQYFFRVIFLIFQDFFIAIFLLIYFWLELNAVSEPLPTTDIIFPYISTLIVPDSVFAFYVTISFEKTMQR